MAKLVDAPGLGPDAVQACRFESDSPHHRYEREAVQKECLPSIFQLFKSTGPVFRIHSNANTGLLTKRERREPLPSLHNSVLVAAAAGAFIVMMMVMMVLAAIALMFVMMVVITTTAGAFLFVMVVMLAATAGTFLFIVMMVVTAAAATAFLLIMVMMAAATAAAFILAMMMVVTAATARAFLIIMMMVMTAAAATAAAGMAFNANRFKSFFNFRNFKTDHAEHLGDVRKRKHGKAFRSFGHFNAAIDESSDRLLHRAQVAGDVKHLFHGGTHNPELAGIVNKNVVDKKRTLFFNGNGNHAFRRFKGILPGHALGRRKNELLGTGKDGLSGSRFGRQELGKGRHF